MANSSNPTTCNYTETKYIIVGILHSTSAAISFLASLLVVGIILLLKKHKFFVQRLILYLSVAAVLYSLAAAQAKTNYFPNHPNDEYCKWIAFACQYTQWSLLLAICVVTIDILIRLFARRSTTKLEIPYLLFIFLVPATFNWLPFKYKLYGKSGAWCWIKTVDETNNCSIIHDGIILQFSIWYGPLFALLMVTVLAYIAIIIRLKLEDRKLKIYNHGNRNQLQLLQNMRKEVWTIFWFPLVYMMLNLFPLANRLIYAIKGHDYFILWVLHAIISPLQGGFIALVYTLDPETRAHSLKWPIIWTSLKELCRERQGHVQEYYATNTHEAEREGLLSSHSQRSEYGTSLKHK